MKKRGFTLVELVVVIAIIAILGAVLTPAYKIILSSNNHSLDKTKLKEINRWLITEKLPAVRVKGIELESENWRFMYHKETSFLAIAEEEIVVDSHNGDLNGRQVSEVENLVELSELEDEELIGGAIYLHGHLGSPTPNPESGGESGSGGSSGGSTSPQEPNPDGGEGGTTEPDQSEGKEWWEELEELTELPEIGSSEYNELMKKEALRLGAAITEIPNKYFNNDKNLQKIYFINLNRIGVSAFESCAELQVVIGMAKEIDKDAFYLCKKLTSFDLSKTTKIGANAFCYCTGIKSIEATLLEEMYDSSFAHMELEKLTIRACNVKATTDTDMHAEFKVDILEIDGGEINNQFSAYLKSIMENNKEKPMTIIIKDITVATDEMGDIIPFEKVGSNITLKMDEKSYENLTNAVKSKLKDPFNNRTKGNGITIIE